VPGNALTNYPAGRVVALPETGGRNGRQGKNSTIGRGLAQALWETRGPDGRGWHTKAAGGGHHEEC
jgi:hypothetical protein